MLKNHLKEKRDELVWALETQGYNNAEITAIFSSVNHRSTALRIMRRKPKDYQPKWIKVRG